MPSSVTSVEFRQHLDARGEQHLDRAADQLAVLAQALELRPDAGRSHRQREILLVAIQFLLDRAAEPDAGVDGHRGVAVDEQLDIVAGRAGASHDVHVRPLQVALRRLDYLFCVDHS